MDTNNIIQIISGVGFPIFCCIYLLKEIEKLRITVENNTRVMWAICTKLGIELELHENEK